MPPRRTRAAKGPVKTTEEVTTDSNIGVVTIDDANESMGTEPNQNDSISQEDDTTETEAKTETADTSTDSKDDIIEVTPIADEQASTHKGDNLFENLTKDADTDSSSKEVKEDQLKKTDNTDTPIKKTDNAHTSIQTTDNTETRKTEKAVDEIKADGDVIEMLDTDNEKEEDISKGAVEADGIEDMEEIDEEANQEMDTTTSSKEETADKTETSGGEAETSGGEEKKEEDKNELTVTVKDKEKQELEDKIPFPESLKKLTQLTVNIGPIKLNDLKSSDLHSVLSLTPDFEIKFEKKEDEDAEKEKKKIRPDSLGYVKMPLKIRSPNFFILIHKKLSSLRIDGRDMSVKFPEQLNIALNDAKKYVEAQNLRAVKKQSEKAEEKSRSVRLQNLPHSVSIDTLKSQFPEALKIELSKIYRGELGGYMVFKSREKAKQWLKENKEVKVEDNKVTTKLSVEDDRLRSPRGGVKNRSRGLRPSRGPRGRGIRGGRSSGRGGIRGGLNGRFGSGTPKNPVRERMEKIRDRQEQVRGKGRRGAARGRGAGPSQGPVAKMMGDLMKIQEQAFARSASQTSPRQLMETPTRAPAKGRGGRGPKRGNRERLIDQSPNRSSQGQFRGGQDRQSPGSGSGRFGRQDSGGFDRNRRFDTSDYEPERAAPRKASASVPSEDDPTAMMAYLKSTLARMEEKISQKSHSGGYQDEGPREKYRGDKRKMDLDDYGRESTKRGTGYGFSEFESQDNYGSLSYSQRDDYGSSSGFGGKSRYGQMDTFGYGTNTDSTDRLGGARGYSGNQGGNYGNRRDQGGNFANRGDLSDSYGIRGDQGGIYGNRSGQGSSNYGNQRYSDKWGGRY